jgi:hypothetical protein
MAAKHGGGESAGRVGYWDIEMGVGIGLPRCTIAALFRLHIHLLPVVPPTRQQIQFTFPQLQLEEQGTKLKAPSKSSKAVKIKGHFLIFFCGVNDTVSHITCPVCALKSHFL